MELSDIKIAVETTLEVNVEVDNRTKKAVDGKIIFFIISKALTKERIGIIVKMTGRKHCIASHYSDKAIDLVKYDKYFREKYVNCLKAVNTKDEDIQNLIKPEFLQNLIKKQKRYE